MENRDIATKVAWKFLGKPYVWGGDDPMAGFDCSGFVIDILKSVGLLPRKGDWTAAQLWDRFLSCYVDIPTEGCLVFWEDRDHYIIHVEYCIDNEFSIGASGGERSIKTIQDAIDQNAYIKIRPFRTRDGIKGFVDPFLGG